MELRRGELVTRHSYKNDLLFRVESVNGNNVILYGEDMRLEADAPMEDLEKVEARELTKRRKKVQEQEEFSYRLFKQDYRLMKEKREYESTAGYQSDLRMFQIPAKVLHLDGDQNYLKKCITLYEKLGLQVHGVHMNEREMAGEIRALIKKVQPNIIVITGHDSYSKKKGPKKDLQAYRHSKYFTETVREARTAIPHLDQLIIFAGACQSHFEALIRTGANFASSPNRVNIHALDPVYIAAKIAYTSFMEKVSVPDVLRNTLTGEKGIGGFETRGLLRTGMPLMDLDETEAEITKS